MDSYIQMDSYETNLNQEVNFLFHRGSYSWSRSMYLCLPSNPWMSEEIDFFNCLVNVESDKGIWMVCTGISGLAVVLRASSWPCDFSCPFISVSSSLRRKGYVTRNYFVQPSIVAKQKRNLKKKPTNCSLLGGIPRYTFKYLAAKPGKSANVLPWVWNPADPASKLLTSLPCWPSTQHYTAASPSPTPPKQPPFSATGVDNCFLSRAGE